MPIRVLLAAIALLVGAASGPAAEEWPQFRGPSGQGHAAATELPLTWGEKENVAWKVEVPGSGWSSPVVSASRVWLTTAGDGGRSLRALCLDRDSGRLLHDVEVFTPRDPPRLNPKNSHASPTPVLEGERVYVHFGQAGTACLTTDGKIVWKAVLPHELYYGPSSTPVLFEDLLLVPCHGTDVRYLVALDTETGKQRWKATRGTRNSDATPLVLRAEGQDQVVSNLADHVVAHDPRTGKELWWVAQPNYAQVPRPVFGHGLVFVCGGYFDPVLHAIRPDGRGDVSASHVAWSHRRDVPQTPSPLLVGDELYLVSDQGVVTCLDARGGKVYWRERLGGAFSASPLAADGRLYFTAEDGITAVLAPGQTFRKLATNRVEGRTLASLAVAGKALFLRTERHLYRLEKK